MITRCSDARAYVRCSQLGLRLLDQESERKNRQKHAHFGCQGKAPDDKKCSFVNYMKFNHYSVIY